MRFISLITVSCLAGFGAVACSSTADIAERKDSLVEQLRSDTPPITNPDISDSEYATFITDANDFGLALYRGYQEGKASATQANSVFSPTSAQVALAMTYGGAVGDTAAGMKQALHDTLGSVKYHAGCNRLLRDLSSRNYSHTDSDGYTWRVEVAPANSLWTDLGVSVKTSFLDLLATQYDSGMYRVDFAAYPDASRIMINDWVSGRTHDRINDLLIQPDIDSTTTFVLVNALYMFAHWDSVFDKNSTQPATFHTLAGTDVAVDTMHIAENLQYKSVGTYDVVQVPYVNRELHMTVVLPQDGAFESTRSQVTGQWIAELSADLAATEVGLSLPKFKIETAQMSLKPALIDLGMQVAFSGGADFSGITPSIPIFISDVIQKAFIGVDEDGTEAAAATAVILKRFAIPPTPVPFTVDRPFLFFIQDKSGLVLFAGQVVDPTK